MGYVSSNLLKNESVAYEANVHWFVFVPWIMLFTLTIIFAEDARNDPMMIISIVFFMIMSIIGVIHAFFYKISSELAVTTKRIISKTGFISRNTVELNHNKVESFSVDQGIFGRIFGYGTVTIHGTGGGKTQVKNIANPVKFRRAAMDIIDKSDNPESQVASS